MAPQTIHIKGMVCNRCVTTVENTLQEMGHQPVKTSLGESSFIAGETHNPEQLEEKLNSLGFAVLKDKREKVIGEVKELVAEVYSGGYDFPERFRFSELVKQRFQKDYTGISDAFIAGEKKNIEQYIIEYRINKVKELLVYHNCSLSDIAFRLNFTSVAHLSAQFKQQTGLTPSYFRSVKQQKTDTAWRH